MRTVGVTAEYNPFHNGHAYHLAKARELTGADCVIAVMSGDFTQRGEPAVCDKWDRAKAAVQAPDGVDLVIELPFAFACSRALVFARGGVDLLVRLGADCISFGCEAEDPDQLREVAAALRAEDRPIEEKRLVYMRDGISSAKAFDRAVSEVVGEEAALLLHEPNNILAVEYLKRILFWRKKGVKMEDLPVKRYGSGYKDASEGAAFAGAGALREMIAEGEDVSRFVPAVPVCEDMREVSDRYLQLLKGVAIRSTPEDLAHCYGSGEGMQNSIIRETRKAKTLDELVSALTSGRYTASTVKRALTHNLMGTTWNEIIDLTFRTPQAGRLLAAGKTGREYMRQMDRDAFQIVTNINKEEDRLDPLDAERLKLDEKAADLYNLLCSRDLYAASDRVKSPYIE